MTIQEKEIYEWKGAIDTKVRNLQVGVDSLVVEVKAMNKQIEQSFESLKKSFDDKFDKIDGEISSVRAEMISSDGKKAIKFLTWLLGIMTAIITAVLGFLAVRYLS